MSRTTISVDRETAMELRAVRLEMSRPGGAMLKVDEVLRALIGSWRESQNQVAVQPEAQDAADVADADAAMAEPGPSVPLGEVEAEIAGPPAGRPAPKRGGRRDAGPGKVRHRCPVKGWCAVCEEMKGGQR